MYNADPSSAITSRVSGLTSRGVSSCVLLPLRLIPEAFELVWCYPFYFPFLFIFFLFLSFYTKQTGPISIPNSWSALPTSTGAISTIGKRATFCVLYSKTVWPTFPLRFWVRRRQTGEREEFRVTGQIICVSRKTAGLASNNLAILFLIPLERTIHKQQLGIYLHNFG